jgi:hypothetical protein
VADRRVIALHELNRIKAEAVERGDEVLLRVLEHVEALEDFSTQLMEGYDFVDKIARTNWRKKG